jgi:ketosteroid isomerase-like protein
MFAVAMLTRAFAEHFAAAWINAWNAHDLEAVLSHYSDDFEMSSPLIAVIAQEPSGTLRGKAAVRAYWSKALQMLPDLRFELVDTLLGADSITLYYKGARGMAAEVFVFDSNEPGKVRKAMAHYA